MENKNDNVSMFNNNICEKNDEDEDIATKNLNEKVNDTNLNSKVNRYTFSFKIKLLFLFFFITLINVGVEFLYRDKLFDWSVEKIVSLHKRNSDTDDMIYKLSILISWLPRFQVTFVVTLLIYNYAYTPKVISVLSATYFGQCLNSLLKLIYNNPRPQWVDDKIHSFKCDPAYGNPSGHSMETTSLFLTLWDVSINHNNLFEGNLLPLKYILLSLIIILIFLISMSRFVLGVHTLNQIIYGNILGLMVFLFIKYIMFEDDYNSDSFFQRYFEDLYNSPNNDENNRKPNFHFQKIIESKLAINSNDRNIENKMRIKNEKEDLFKKDKDISSKNSKNKYDEHDDLRIHPQNSELIISVKDINLEKDSNYHNEIIQTCEEQVFEKKELSFKDFKMRWIIVMIVGLINISALAFYFYYRDSDQELKYNSIIDKRCGKDYSTYKRLSNKQLEVCLNISAFLFIIFGIEFEIFLLHDKNLNSFYKNLRIWNDTAWWKSIIRFIITGGIVVGIYYGISSIIPETKYDFTGDISKYNRSEIESDLALLIIFKGPLPQILIMFYVFFLNKFICSKIMLINI